MRITAALAYALLAASPLFAQSSAYIEVTATKVEEDALRVPASITVISGEELRLLGATDLASVLSLAGGVAVAPGGDSGPAGFVPELWGLREIDAFLLVVDGVPWGGAFNPLTTAVDLHDVERIEIVRGSAPVVYGATAFSGVIQVIHRTAGERRVTLSGGTFGSASAAVQLGALTADIARERFRDDRAGADRGHLGYRVARGAWRFDADVLRLQQDPSSPHLREGRVLSPRVALDSNQNPAGAHLDTTRVHLGATYDAVPFVTTIALARTTDDILRGFLADPATGESNGFSQDRRVTDLYFDTHIVKPLGSNARLIAGFDHLGGWADADSEAFEYDAGQPVGADEPRERSEVRDRRQFSAVYAQGEFTPGPDWRFDAGARLNHVRETRNDDSLTTTRGSGFLGASRRVTGDVWAFADYRNTFKPAAIDFGVEEEEEGGEILEPESSQSYEAGIKGRTPRLFWQASAFVMNMENLVVAQEEDGLPVLRNAGKLRFKGIEVETSYRVTDVLRATASYARHDSRFGDYVQDFDGVPTQLRGKRFEMSARDLASAGLLFGSASGWNANVTASYTGSRYLNKRNTAPAGGFTAVNAGLGYAAPWGELRLDGRNLTNRRDPVAESELGDAQYYLLPARTLRVMYTRRF